MHSYFRCKVEGCSRIFTSVGGLRTHMVNKHPDAVTGTKTKTQVTDMVKKKNRVCNICQKVFNSPQALKHHKNQEHTTANDYVCTVCDRVFKQQRYLTEHARSHQKKHKCLYCTKEYGHKKTMMRHMRQDHKWTG